MKELRDLFFLVVLIAGLSTVPAMAEMSKGHGHGKSSMGHGGAKHSTGSKKGYQGGHRKGHLHSPQWKDALTDDQKKQADRMHVQLQKDINILKAKLKVKKAELSNLIVQDSPNTNAIHSKIDEIVEFKGKIMRKKYDHMVEMRGILTSEQRVSFDMGILQKAGHKGGHGHR